MPLKKFIASIPGAVRGAKGVALQGFDVLSKDLAVTIYSIFVFLLLLIIIPLVNTILLGIANNMANEPIFDSAYTLVKIIFVALAVFISAACAAMLLSYFACAVAASTLAHLEGHPAPLLRGLKVFRNRFRHITKFAMVSIAYIPLGFLAQSRKMADGTHINRAEVIGSSVSLSTAQLAPAILYEDKGIYDTIEHSVETLGKAWREGIVIKAAIYSSVIFLSLLISLAPSVANKLFSDTTASNEISKFIIILLVICLLLTAKVLGTVFSATLYWKVSSDKERKEIIS